MNILAAQELILWWCVITMLNTSYSFSIAVIFDIQASDDKFISTGVLIQVAHPLLSLG